MIKKYVCQACGEIDEIIVLEENRYKWEPNVPVGNKKISCYLRSWAGDSTISVKCAKCGAILKREEK